MTQDVRNTMPSEGFFPAYVRHARTQTDAPDVFHLGTALAMFSAVAARTSTLTVPGGTPLPLHLWVLLLGGSGERKTTAIRIGERVLAGCPNEKGTEPLFPLMALSRSPETTFDMLARTPHGLLLYPEASSFFGVLRRPWWGGVEGFLPDLFDGRTMKRSLSGKRTVNNPHPLPIEIEIEKPRVAFLGGISLDLVATTVRPKDLVGGLLGRMLLLWGERTRFKEAPGRPSKGAEERLRGVFQWRTAGPARVCFTAEVWERYKTWSRTLDGERRNFTNDKRAMATRLMGHVLRVAALYRLGTPPEVGDAEVMEAALALGDLAKVSVLKLPPVGAKRRIRTECK